MKTENGGAGFGAALKSFVREQRYSLLLLPVCLLLCILTYFLASKLSEKRFAAAMNDAEQAEPQTREGAVFYNALSAKEQMLYDAMTAAAGEDAEETEILVFVPTQDEFSRACEAFFCENPGFYCVEPDAFVLKTSAHTSAVQMAYCENPAEYRGETEAHIARLLSGVPDGTEYEKLLYLHDALTACAVCADENAETIGRTAAEVFSGTPSDSRAYALAYSLLCTRAGLSCRVVAGKDADGRALYWNEVTADGVTGYTDVFWDDSPEAAVTLPFHGYFFLDRTETERERTFDARFAKAQAGETQDYYEYMGSVPGTDGTEALLGKLLSDAREKHADALEFRLPEDLPEETLRSMLADAAERANETGTGALLQKEFRVYRLSAARAAYTVRIYYEETGA